MNIRRERPASQKSRLENEVILAVVILYLLLSAALLAIHFAMPSGAETSTSSTSPSHSDRAPASAPSRATEPAQDATVANKKHD